MSMIADKIEKFILDRMREEQLAFLMSAVSMLNLDVV